MSRSRKSSGWLILAVQLPATPSSARVALWRRMRAVGAVGIIQGTWILPCTDSHRALLQKEIPTVQANGGAAILFACREITGVDSAELFEHFRAERAREYCEFAERTDNFLAEIVKETQVKKFTFAELEELEDDLVKLKAWLNKIIARDFFPDERLKDAQAKLDHCKQLLFAFTQKVYASEGATGTKRRLAKRKDVT